MKQPYKLSKEQLEYYTKELKLTKNEISDLTEVDLKTLRKYYKIYEIEEYHKCLYCGEDNINNLPFSIWKNKKIYQNVCIKCRSKNLSEALNALPEEIKILSHMKAKNTLEERKKNLSFYNKEKYKNKDLFYEEYIINNKSLNVLRNEWGCTEEVLLKYLKIYNFEEKYTCEKCGSSENLIEKRVGFKYRRNCSLCDSKIHFKIQKDRQNEKDKLLNFNKDLIEDLHYNKGLSKNLICKELNIGIKKVNSLFKKYNIIEQKSCDYCGNKTDLVQVFRENKLKTYNICNSCMVEKQSNNGSCKGYSKISQNLFWNIYKFLPRELLSDCYFAELNKEYSVSLTEIDRIFLQSYKKLLKYDFCIIYRGFSLIIEFNGDIFHGNPKLFNKDDFPNPMRKDLTASDLWKLDEIRKDYISANGGYLITIWEEEYKEYKEECIKYCLDEIYSFFNNITKLNQTYEELIGDIYYGF